MLIDSAAVRSIAHMARIAVTDEEVAELEREFRSILDWIAQLEGIDTEAVEPMVCAVPTGIKMRPDVADADVPWEQLVENAPQSHDGFFIVPKVVE